MLNYLDTFFVSYFLNLSLLKSNVSSMFILKVVRYSLKSQTVSINQRLIAMTGKKRRRGGMVEIVGVTYL